MDLRKEFHNVRTAVETAFEVFKATLKMEAYGCAQVCNRNGIVW